MSASTPGPGPVRRLRNYRDLVAWQKALRLAEWSCQVTLDFPRWAGLTLGTQIQRAAIAIPSNLAEGHELPTASYRQHVRVALGSLAELETQLELAIRLGFLDRSAWQQRQRDVRELECMLRALRAALTRHITAVRSGKTAGTSLV